MPYLRVKNELPLIPGYSEGSIAYASDAAAAPLNKCICYINPVQDLHGQDYPYPSGGGINKWDEETELGIYNTTTGQPEPTAFSLRGKNRFAVLPNTTYYANNNYVRRLYYDENDNYISYKSGIGVDITPANCHYMRIYLANVYGTTYHNDISINYPSTDTNYHPYSNICPITGHTELNLVQKDGNDTVVHTFTTDLGTTVYGGTLDVTTGVLTIDRAIYTFDGTETAIAYGSGWRYVVLTGKEAKSYGSVEIPNLISNQYVAINRNQISSGVEGASVTVDAILLSTDTPTGVQICYELATPATTQLTPQEVTTLLGENSFYHDCNGDTKITYIRRNDS